MLLYKAQRGSVMLITLAVIVLLTIWGLGAVKNSSFMLQGNHNARLKQVSQEAAEYALRQAENLVRARVTQTSDIPVVFIGANGYHSRTQDLFNGVDLSLINAAFDYQNPAHWLDALNVGGFTPIQIVYDDRSGSVTKMVNQPRAVIEYMGRDRYDTMTSSGFAPDPAAKEMFRITAIGWGPRGESSTVLRSHVVLAIK
jgi:Tfp pilus assembly protein PilX